MEPGDGQKEKDRRLDDVRKRGKAEGFVQGDSSWVGPAGSVVMCKMQMRAGRNMRKKD